MFQVTCFLSILAVSLMSGQNTSSRRALVSVYPHEATVYVGESLQFSATVIDASSGIKWSVAEKDGGSIDMNGFYQAPQRIGVFHIIATSEADPHARTLVRVTVVVDGDADP